VTLKGADADGDDLTYVVVREPSSGRLTGDEPFLTYTPKSGFSGTDSFTYKVNDGQADSPTVTVSITVEMLRWVRDGEVVINVEGAPLEYYSTEPRFEGTFTTYSMSETSIAMDDRFVDHGFEYYNVSIQSTFDTPPEVLSSGQFVTLTAQFTHGGTVTEGDPGAAFHYSADNRHSKIIQPAQSLSFYPWHPDFKGPDSMSWTLTVPQGRPGDTFQVWATWWNCPVCNVMWQYIAE
jgi:hypothetical protein